MPDPSLLVEDLQVWYPGQGAPAVDHATWSAQPGTVTALLGPNGAGKTSTIECCVGLRAHQGGRIVALGREGRGLDSPAHRAEVGVMLQDGGLPTGARPLALLKHLARLYASPADVAEIAERLDITSFAQTGVRRLSGGQRQRLALAAALIGRPRLLFLDEPTAGLDTNSRVRVREVLGEQCADGVAVVLTTHDLDEASRVAHRVVVMSRGRVVADDAPARLAAGLPRTLVVTLPVGADPSGLLARVPVLAPHAGRELRAVGPSVGPAELAAAGQWCAENGYEAAGLELRSPSLEDVVLDLTDGAP